MRVTQEQIEIIRNTVNQDRIKILTLRDDIIDHICCVVEYHLYKGKAFETALREAIDDLAPNGLDEIERETIFLLNHKKIIRMKTIMYTIGLITAIGIAIGTLFKLLHWPGADEIFTAGYIGSCSFICQ
jgi:hypothetical protein